jgi:ribosome biogenesis GTPase
MVPKFRGDSDDWLDNEKARGKVSGGAKNKKKAAAKNTQLPWDQANGTVSEVFQNLCRVRLDEGHRELLCSYRRSGVIGHAGGSDRSKARERTPVTVGDRVKAEKSSPDSGIVEGVCERKNSLARLAPGRDGTSLQHVIAANIDLLAVVAAVESPEFSPGLVDRYLVAGASAGIPTLLIITKVDLPVSGEPLWKTYTHLNTLVFEVSSRSGAGIDTLRDFLTGKTVVFCGKSGVGKTSLLRQLLGVDIGKVAEISEATGKGRHTTTGSILLGGPSHSQWIDTPGVREFALVNVESTRLQEYFPEFASLACTEQHCTHLEEENCQARDTPRYASYRRIHESLVEQEAL